MLQAATAVKCFIDWIRYSCSGRLKTGTWSNLRFSPVSLKDSILIPSSNFKNSILVSIREPVKAPSALTTVIIPHLEPEGTKELDKDGTGKNGKKTWFYSTVFYEKKFSAGSQGQLEPICPPHPPVIPCLVAKVHLDLPSRGHLVKFAVPNRSHGWRANTP